MKLRIRSLETKQTLTINVPSSCCTLQQLKHLISQSFPSSSAAAAENSIHLSLNKKDELHQTSEQDTLQSIGITSGDLIFFTLNSNVFSISSETHIPKLKNMDTQVGQECEELKNLDTQVGQKVEKMETQIGQKVEKTESQIGQECEKVEKMDPQIGQECEKVKNMDTQVVQEGEKVKNMDPQIVQKVEKMDTQVGQESEKVKNMDTQVGQKVEKMESQVGQEGEKVKNMDTQVGQEGEKVKNMDTQVGQEGEKVKNMDSQVGQEGEKVKSMDTQMDEETEMVKKMDTQRDEEAEGVDNLDPHEAKALSLLSQLEETDEFMEVDDGNYSDVNFAKSFSVPGFLRNVFTEELNDDGGRDHKLLVVAVHAVFVESGFVLVDPLTFTEVSGCQFLKYWPSGDSRMRLFYTLPEVIDHVKRGSGDVIHSVELKFQSLGKFFIAHGSLSGGISVSTRRVTLNEDQLVPFLNVVWANCGLNEEVDGAAFGEKEVFVFWRNVKDGLVLPLLIDLCEKSGLVLPPCFTRLPTDLKLKILESLPGVEIAKVSCLSSELRYLGSSDDLWKKKYVEQFGDGETSGEGGHWKEKFVKSWESRKRRKVICIARPVTWRFLGGQHPFPVPWMPHIIGGDYDLLPPQFDNTGNPLGRAALSRLLHPWSNHVPHRQLGGRRNHFT